MHNNADTEPVHIEKVRGLRWTAVYTKPRCEKLVAEYCRHHGLTCYLPLRKRAERYQRRTVVTFLPMFPGYVFAHLSPEARALVNQAQKTVAVLPVGDAAEDTLIRDLTEIQLLEHAELEAELMVQPELVPGKPVRITGGPLAGLTGVVERRQQKARVTVNVEMLGQSACVELDIGEVDIGDD